MSDLVEFLRACIAEDKEDASDAAGRSAEWVIEDRTRHEWGAYDDDAVILGGGKPLAVCSAEYGGGLVAEHIARWDPARVLAECEAKLLIVEEATQGNRCQGHPGSHQPHADYREYGGDYCRDYDGNPFLRFLALPYADRPGYREEWRP